MISAILIFTRYHDIMTTFLSVFGALAIIGIIQAIYKSNLTYFKLSGLVCIILIGINNLIYYSGNSIKYLPLVQKITIIVVLAWTVGLNLNMIKKTPYNKTYKQ